ncbi:hypothetical protein [Mycobacterium leprae]|uniref:hypothetical protein n=1 Tax=Mycobacterium leprae TaxID=1769 RepID=UPI000319C9F3|nr:hypothetical protein [Mycobacterium leprae]
MRAAAVLVAISIVATPLTVGSCEQNFPTQQLHWWLVAVSHTDLLANADAIEDADTP